MMASETLKEKLVDYLTDVHSAEENALQMLRTGVDSVDEPRLADALREHLAETEEHEHLVRERLEAHGAGTSTVKDVVGKGGAMASGAVAKIAPDTSGKTAIQSYAFEHLEIASYRMLRLVADQAEDPQTVQVADRILAQEQAAAQKLEELLEPVAQHDLEQQEMAA
jgi:ferritin-like metal-binding protein YciE